MEITEKKDFITSEEDFINIVCDSHRKNDTLLDHTCFDFNVSMMKRDIIHAYARCQAIINDNSVVRIRGKEEYNVYDKRFLDPNEYEDIYEGNCKEFLMSFNGKNIFMTNNGQELLDFIF